MTLKSKFCELLNVNNSYTGGADDRRTHNFMPLHAVSFVHVDQ